MAEPMTESELRKWAETVKEHSAAARRVLILLDDLAMWRKTAEQGVAIQKELIAELRGEPGRQLYPAEMKDLVESTLREIGPHKFDGSTGTPTSGVAGRKSESEQ